MKCKRSKCEIILFLWSLNNCVYSLFLPPFLGINDKISVIGAVDMLWRLWLNVTTTTTTMIMMFLSDNDGFNVDHIADAAIANVERISMVVITMMMALMVVMMMVKRRRRKKKMMMTMAVVGDTCMNDKRKWMDERMNWWMYGCVHGWKHRQATGTGQRDRMNEWS